MWQRIRGRAQGVFDFARGGRRPLPSSIRCLVPRRSFLSILLTALVAVGIGASAWHGRQELIALSAVIPVMIFRQWNRKEAFLVAFAYYAAASWPIIPGVLAYFKGAASVSDAALFWLIPCLLLPLPWIFYWTGNTRDAGWRLPLAYVLSIIPPIGIIGWASPLTAAGILFPGTKWLGLFALAALSSFACVSPWRAAVATIAMALLAHANYPGDAVAPSTWEGVSTCFDVVNNANDPMPEFEAASSVRRIALSSTSRVLVFPESTVPRWTEATEAFWRRTTTAVHEEGKTLLIGAELPIRGTRRYRNAVVRIGERSIAPFLQRIPVPVIMWNPVDPERSAPLETFSPGTIQVDDERVAILVCYEQLLTWPILRSAMEAPTVIVGLANDHWAQRTPIPDVQKAAVAAWARLFRLPRILGVNQ
jgi:hypothetical protein